MFLLVILACIALANAQGSYHHAQPYDFGYAIRDHHSRQYRQEAGNGVGAVVGSYGYVDGRGNIQYNNYGVGAGYGVPVYGGYGLGYGGYGLGYGGYGLGYGVYGLGNIGYGYGGASGYNALLRNYGDVYYGADLV
ncbi:hypothetical protein AVEN_22159-1 [Araneus ventricosus]|uniref:Uncharacterized protein n=1 Tax=Araneus ventricosus TaxID=182803 RepID=A0A4Y2KMN8_ARAVE|nr:hypothetical protein AVEN_22159-1 [Araneus ventricosus]